MNSVTLIICIVGFVVVLWSIIGSLAFISYAKSFRSPQDAAKAGAEKRTAIKCFIVLGPILGLLLFMAGLLFSFYDIMREWLMKK